MDKWLPAVIFIAILTVWEWCVRTGSLSSLFFPPPSVLVVTVVRLIASGELVTHVSATLSRVLLGFALGGVSGLILGLAMGWSNRLRIIIDPFVAAAHPVPKIAILPLIMIVFGIGEASKVVVVAVATFFPMLINAMAGVRQISAIHFEVAQNYGANMINTFTRVVAFRNGS